MSKVTKIHLRLSNAYLIQGERAILVDSGSPGEGRAIQKALAQAGVDASDLSLLLHTHGHSDHAGSTAELRRLSGAPAAIHAANVALLRRGRNGPLPPTRLEARMIRPLVDKPFPAVEPDIVFDQELDLAPYGVDGRGRFGLGAAGQRRGHRGRCADGRRHGRHVHGQHPQPALLR